jgi:hypothetical protein
MNHPFGESLVYRSRNKKYGFLENINHPKSGPQGRHRWHTSKTISPVSMRGKLLLSMAPRDAFPVHLHSIHSNNL